MLLYKLLLLELGSHVIASGIFESKYQHTLEYFIIVSLFTFCSPIKAANTKKIQAIIYVSIAVNLSAFGMLVLMVLC